jgi:hypothetical protein
MAWFNHSAEVLRRRRLRWNSLLFYVFSFNELRAAAKLGKALVGQLNIYWFNQS